MARAIGNTMKKVLPFLLLFIFCGQLSVGQNGLTETEKLSATAKIWGFLKYYHPEVAVGTFNWDKELLRIIPEVEAAESSEELSRVFLAWIESLGVIDPCKRCDKKKNVRYFDKNFDLSWTQNAHIFTPELSNKLKFIEDNRHLGDQHYVAYYKGKPKMAFFRNEMDYEEFDWQNSALRLLALFRYWNRVEYFFPAKFQMDQDWGEVLTQMIPKFYDPESEEELYRAMVELVVHLDDSHALIYPRPEFCNFGCYTVPVEFKFIDDYAIITKLYDHELAALDDLEIGDIITKVEGQEIKQVFDVNAKYIHGSNASKKKINAGYYLLNGSTESVAIEGIKNGKTYAKSIKRYLFKEFEIKDRVAPEKYKLIDDSIGYIDIGRIETKEVPKVMEALRDTRAIIFDLRKSKASTPFYFSNYITSQKRDFYKAIYPDLDYPGRFIWTENHKSGNDKLKYTGKVILLVDEYCQSQMEFTAMCLQTGDHVTTIGRQTSGAIGNVIRFNLVGGFKTQMTGIGLFYPDGEEAQRKGVKIDIEVEPSIEATIEGRDEILERAIEFAKE